MNDLEIETRIAEIEGHTLVHSNNWGKYVIGKPYCADEVVYEPLTNDALCFQLMVKYDVNIDRDCDSAFIMDDYRDSPHKANISFAIDMDVRKAILLAIIEAHNET